MRKKQFDNKELVEYIKEFAASKNTDSSTVIDMLRDVLQSLITKKFGPGNEFNVVIDPKKSELQVFRARTIVADPAPAEKREIGVGEISLSEARKIESDFEIGEEVAEEVKLDDTFLNRRTVMDAIQLFIQKKDAIEKKHLYEHYRRLIGKIIDVEIGYSKPNFTILYDDDKNEIFLPKEKQIPKERFRKGSNIKVIIEDVENKRGKVQIVVSRVSPLFLKELLTKEIPEICDNIVVIKNLVRMPGIRSKVIVESQDDRIDAAGACIGRNARRIQTISREHLNNERVDIITNTENLNLFVKRIAGLSFPVQIEEDENTVVIRIKPEQMSLLNKNKPFLQRILGKEVLITADGASSTDMQRKEHMYEEDVYLDDFANEIDVSIINVIKDKGLITAKDVLKTPKENLVSNTKLDLETVENVYDVLAKEFGRHEMSDAVVHDIPLDELASKIDSEVISKMKSAGLMTVKNVLDTPKDQLVASTNLDKEIVHAVYDALSSVL